MKSVLVVDDDEILRKQVYWALRDSYRLMQATDRTQMNYILQRNSIDLVLLDLHLPPRQKTAEEGIKALKEIKRVNPEIKIIVITGDREEETPLNVINDGAYDYFSKPLSLEEIKVVLDRALYLQDLERRNKQLRRSLVKKYKFAQMIGKSGKMRELFEIIEKIAQSDCTVLIRGESGTGKELVSRAIHYNSPRKDKPFVAVNCAAIPENLLESELFGYEKGAFTEATSRKPGKFELAEGGTIFLDEINDMSLAMQAKILRIIQERTFERLGGTESIKVDVRLIAATNKDLEKSIKDGLFREDLYYRLDVVSFFLPPLRERKEDIPLLVNYFLRKFSQLNYKNVNKVSSQVLNLLIQYDWPGNVRELENVIERAIVLSEKDIILPEHLPLRLRQSKKDNSSPLQESFTLDKTEKKIIMETLRLTNWNQSRAAEKLGIHRNTLRRKIRRFGIIPQ